MVFGDEPISIYQHAFSHFLRQTQETMTSDMVIDEPSAESKPAKGVRIGRPKKTTHVDDDDEAGAVARAGEETTKAKPKARASRKRKQPEDNAEENPGV